MTSTTMTSTEPLLRVQDIRKHYTRGWPRRERTFSLAADFEVARPSVVGVLGPNGSGKTTLLELMTGSNRPDGGVVRVAGQDIHGVRTHERDRLAIHYHQSYQVRAFGRHRPNFMLDRALSDSPLVHLFDEPQFNTQDGYIGFMLEFFARLKASGRVVFLCLHPNERFHMDILRQSCERFLFVQKGAVTQFAGFDALMHEPRVREYLGALARYPGH